MTKSRVGFWLVISLIPTAIVFIVTAAVGGSQDASFEGAGGVFLALVVVGSLFYGIGVSRAE